MRHTTRQNAAPRRTTPHHPYSNATQSAEEKAAAAACEEEFLASFGRERALVTPDEDSVVFFKPLFEGGAQEQFNAVAREQAETIAKLASELAAMPAGGEEGEVEGEAAGVAAAAAAAAAKTDSSFVMVEAEGAAVNGESEEEEGVVEAE